MTPAAALAGGNRVRACGRAVDDLLQASIPACSAARYPESEGLVSLRIDRDVLEHFQEGGAGWQERINEALTRTGK